LDVKVYTLTSEYNGYEGHKAIDSILNFTQPILGNYKIRHQIKGIWILRDINLDNN